MRVGGEIHEEAIIIAKLLIPEDAKRTTPLFGRMCRAEFVKVLELDRDVSLAKCKFSPDRIYYVGGTIRTLDHGNDGNTQIGVTEGGIHFYLTREEVRQNIWYPPIMPTMEYWESDEIYRGWIGGIKCLNQPDNQESRWRAGMLFDAYAAKLMNQWDEETNANAEMKQVST